MIAVKCFCQNIHCFADSLIQCLNSNQLAHGIPNTPLGQLLIQYSYAEASLLAGKGASYKVQGTMKWSITGFLPCTGMHEQRLCDCCWSLRQGNILLLS